jgi:predicted lactoylglutathione lyase
MSTKIFVNLPVKDLDKSKAFFAALGYAFNAQFTDETAACMVISDDIYAMLLTEAKFRDFSPRPIADAHKVTEVLLALSCDSKDKVNEMADKAVAAGGTEVRPPQDHGFMFLRTFADLDGHIWEVFWMDPATVQQG